MQIPVRATEDYTINGFKSIYRIQIILTNRQPSLRIHSTLFKLYEYLEGPSVNADSSYILLHEHAFHRKCSARMRRAIIICDRPDLRSILHLQQQICLGLQLA